MTDTILDAVLVEGGYENAPLAKVAYTEATWIEHVVDSLRHYLQFLSNQISTNPKYRPKLLGYGFMIPAYLDRESMFNQAKQKIDSIQWCFNSVHWTLHVCSLFKDADVHVQLGYSL